MDERLDETEETEETFPADLPTAADWERWKRVSDPVSACSATTYRVGAGDPEEPTGPFPPLEGAPLPQRLVEERRLHIVYSPDGARWALSGVSRELALQSAYESFCALYEEEESDEREAEFAELEVLSLPIPLGLSPVELCALLNLTDDFSAAEIFGVARARGLLEGR